jgi:hypothetical protein
MGLFTLAQAREDLAELRPLLDEIVVVRADVVELTAALTPGGAPTSLGGLPERKAAEARLNELMTQVQETGVELKGLAPLLLDFPADLDGVPVLLCRRYDVFVAGQAARRSWSHLDVPIPP